MCLAVPMKVIKIDGDEGIVGTDTLNRKANFTMLKGVRVGDYILLHAGFAISKVKPEEARKTIKMAKEVNGFRENE